MTFNFRFFVKTFVWVLFRSKSPNAPVWLRRAIVLLASYALFITVETGNWTGFLLDDLLFPGHRQQKIEELRSRARELKETETIEKRSNALGWIIPLGIAVTVSVFVFASTFGDTLFEEPDSSDSLLAAIAQTAHGAQNWSVDQLAPSRVNVNNQWFSMYAPQGPPSNDGTAIVWSDTSNGQGRAFLYVRVAQVQTPATVDAAKQMANTGQQQPVITTRSGQIPSGWSSPSRPKSPTGSSWWCTGPGRGRRSDPRGSSAGRSSRPTTGPPSPRSLRRRRT